MPLPVLSSSAVEPVDLVRLFHQSELDWSRHLGEELTLDGGTLISNPALPAVAEANCFVNARQLPGIRAAQLFDEVQSRSIGAGVRCRRWILNPSAPTDQTAPLAEYLTAIGWSRSVEDILILRNQRLLDIPSTDLTVIPARAGFGHYRRLMEQTAAPGDEQAANAAMLHLDDSHFDAILAIKEGEPIATIGVLTAGEVGALRQGFVAASHRQRGIGRFMLGRILDLCGRAGFRHVMTAVVPASPGARLLGQAGFAKIGEWKTFSSESID